jgi:5'-deoxynucleotidase YfbR-like HD superfamily hydrolase
MKFSSCLRRIIGVLAVAAMLAGCSTIKLGYNNIDEIALWWLDGYIDFNDDQEARVREDLQRLQRWHRANELPRFSALLHDMEEAAHADITPAQVCGFVTRVRGRLDALSEQAEPAVVTLATSLAPEQLKNLERKYQKNNSKFRKDWINLNASELSEKRVEQFTERSEMIYGQLDDAQTGLLRKQLQSSAFDPQRILADRQRRQRDMLDTLRAVTAPKASLGEARTLMRRLLDRLREPPAAADRASQQAMIDEGCRTFSVLHNSTTPVQRNAAAKRLRAWQRDLQELGGQR